MTYDAIIIGGSYAGISAALQLARARRNVLVVDAGQRRNRTAPHAHGFLTRDGTDPSEMWRIAKEQLLAYPTITWRDDRVIAADNFTLTLGSGERVTGARLLLAVGVIDELPDLPGIAERWGTSVFVCPYCHGYELDEQPIAVIATHPQSAHTAQLLPDWGPTTYFTRGLFEPEPDVLLALGRRRVTIDRTPIVRISGTATVELADKREQTFSGLFVATKPRMPEIVGLLGVALEQGPVGPYVQTDPMKETSVRGVFAAGDLALVFSNIALAVADGVRAGASLHQSLIR